MKTPSRVILGLALATLALAPAAGGATFEAAFADPAWNGKKAPDGQQCQKFGGKGVSPELEVGGIPEGANAIVLEFSDRSYAPMDNGGHGMFGFEIEPRAGAVTVPSVPGHTFDLPPGFFLVREQQAPSWDQAGAYLPPCSGGRGNAYYVTVKAVHRQGEEIHELASVVLEMGTY